MSTDQPQVTPEQAREQLAATQTRSLPSGHDRRIHAVATAVFGCSVAFYMASRNVFSGAERVVVSGVFVAVWMGGAIWVERAARTVPRRARLWSRLGIGLSFLLALGLVLPWLNLQAQTVPNSLPMVLVASFVVAVPSLIAAAAIAGRRR